MRTTAIVLGFLLFTAAAGAQEAPPPDLPTAPADAAKEASVLPDSAWKAIDEALGFLNMARADLEFDKTPIQDAYRLKIAQEMLDRPLENFDRASRIARDLEASKGDPAAAIEVLEKILDVEPGGSSPEPEGEETLEGAYRALFGDDFAPDPGKGKPLPEAVRKTLVLLLYGAAQARTRMEKAFAGLGEGGRALLANRAPELLAEAIADVKSSGPDVPPTPQDEDALFALALKVDRKELVEGARKLAARVARAVEDLSAPGAIEGLPASEPRLDGPATGDVLYAEETPWGPVIVGGPGETVYRKDAFLVIDLGGDDRYLGRVGAAAGWCRGRPPASVCIDLGGNDDYVSRKSLDQGAGLMGIGILWDAAGNDSYRAKDYAQGAGLFGAGALVDGDGLDRYEGDRVVQGAGAFGVGLLVERGGPWLDDPAVTEVSSNDRYDACLFSQGFGYVHGAGCIVDLEGNDVYYAGGRYLHAPLYTDRFQSLSQGFGFGSRPRASGGAGILYDRHGNDVYNAEIYGQGSSYWLAYGLLADDRGNDSYTLTHYGQGAGIHLSTAVLLDRRGNDSYVAMAGCAQAGPHDLAVGVLLDLEGNDRYACSGVGQACGWTNSVGLFLDLGGDDAYTGYAGKGDGTGISIQGFSAKARGFPSVGIFYDAWGRDAYSVGKDGATWVVPVGGVGIDRPGVKPEEERK